MAWRPGPRGATRIAALTLGAEEWPGAEVPGYLPAWWAAWILSNILGNQELRLAWKGDQVSLELSTWLGLGNTVLSLVATVLVIRLIRDIGRRLEQKRQRSKTGYSPGLI